MFVSYISYIVVLLTASTSFNVSKNLYKRTIPYFSSDTKQRCSVASMCRTAQALKKILEQQTKAISEQGKQFESSFKIIEKSLMELQEKVMKLSDEVSQQEKGVAMMKEASGGFDTKLTDQVKQMSETFTKSTAELSKKLETVESLQAKQKERSQEQDTKINKLEEDQLKAVKELHEPKPPKPTPPSLTNALEAGVKARLNVQLLQAESKLKEAEARAQSSEEQSQQQTTKILTMENELAAMTQKSKENEARIKEVKILPDAVENKSKQTEATLTGLAMHNIDLKGKIDAADTSLNVLEMDAKFNSENVDKLNGKIPDVKEKLFKAESALEQQDQKLNAAANSSPGSSSQSCPFG